jgi:hypothetical protein
MPYVNEITNHKEFQNSSCSIGCLTSCAVLLEPTVNIELSLKAMKWLIKSRYAFPSLVSWKKGNSTTCINFWRCKGLYWKIRGLLYSISCCSCLRNTSGGTNLNRWKNTNQDVSSSGINKDMKRAKIIQTFFFTTKLFNFFFCVTWLWWIFRPNFWAATCRHVLGIPVGGASFLSDCLGNCKIRRLESSKVSLLRTEERPVLYLLFDNAVCFAKTCHWSWKLERDLLRWFVWWSRMEQFYKPRKWSCSCLCIQVFWFISRLCQGLRL